MEVLGLEDGYEVELISEGKDLIELLAWSEPNVLEELLIVLHTLFQSVLYATSCFSWGVFGSCHDKFSEVCID
jgi:hypothetical protein